jgi:hypothetical protein
MERIEHLRHAFVHVRALLYVVATRHKANILPISFDARSISILDVRVGLASWFCLYRTGVATAANPAIVANWCEKEHFTQRHSWSPLRKIVVPDSGAFQKGIARALGLE